MTKVSAIQCPSCKVIIYSRARHDFHSCSCGSCSIDGGFDYVRLAWDSDKLPVPEPFQLEVFADKKQLYQDWNNREDKFGWVYPKIQNKRKEKRKMNKKVTPLLQEHSKRKSKSND